MVFHRGRSWNPSHFSLIDMEEITDESSEGQFLLWLKEFEDSVKVSRL